MKHMEQIRDMLCDELDEIAKKGQLTMDSLDVVDMITHSIKSIDTILAMEEAGYNHDYSRGYSRRRGRSYHHEEE